MSERANSWSVYRHVFTSAPENFPGGGGFKTVAYAAALREMVSTIEPLVESYTNQDGGGAQCRQFLPLARGKAYALTIFTSLPDSPDGRTGNFWAETQVVPSDWLDKAGWDAAAAFDTLSWLGPRSLDDLPRDLEPDLLSPLERGSVERLALLGKLVPSDCLELLLQSIAQQSRGLRSLELLEAQGAPASHLEKVVMLLPLTVPPTSRRYSVADQLRCLTLRTRCPVRGMTLRTDITGYPVAAAGRFESSDGLVIDLAGRAPANSPGDRFGRDYAKWLQGVVERGEWDQLENLYKRAIDFPGASFVANYKSLLQAPSRSRITVPAEVPEPAAMAPERASDRQEPSGIEVSESPVEPPAAAPEEPAIKPIQDWQQEASARDVLEGDLWKVRESHRSRIEELVGKIGKDFAADVDKANARLVKETAALQKGLDEKLKELEKEAKKVDKKPSKRAQQKSASPGQESSSVEAKLEALDRELAEVAERLEALEGRMPRSFRDLLTLPLDWFRAHRRPILWGTGIGLVLVVLGFFALRGAWDIPSWWFAPNDRLALKARMDALLPRVQPGKNAALLLESAARREQVAPWAHLETLSIALSHSIQIEGKLECALLQTALRVPVDGNCGQGTIDALVYAPKGSCCQSFQTNPSDGTKFRNCFVTDHLRLGPEEGGRRVEACGGESPWRQGRIWMDEEASSALTLFQTASHVYQGDPDSELAKGLRNLDPSQSPSLRQSLANETLTPEEAQRVLELAWAAWRGEQVQLDDLTVEQLADLGRFVDEIVGQGEGAPGGADGGSAVR